MPDEIQPCFLRALSVQGFRAYLDPKTFNFASKRSLAVFAPNGSGKSSIVDAVEFMFSDSGTLDRLGLRAIHNSAGPSALIHNLADDRKIAPQVAMTFRKGTTETQGTRSATGQRERPAAATAVWAGFAVNPIIRGHSLRRFVEEQKAEERYGEVAKWLQLTPLVMVQKNLRALRVQIKAATEDTAATKANDALVARATAGVVKAWNAADVLSYINEAVLQPLDDTLTLANFDKTDPSFVTIEERAKAEEKQHGLPSLRQARDQLLSVYAQEPDPEGGAFVRTGALATYEAAIETLDNAEATEADERSKAASAIFAAVWDAAEPLFAEGQPEIDVCPVCETPIAATAAGSADEISAHIAAHKAELAAYSASKAALVTAKASATSAQQRMILRLEQLPDWLTDAHPDLKLAMNGYLPQLKAEPSKAPDSTDLVAALLNALSPVSI